MSRFNYSRRVSHAVRVADIAIGGDNPIRVQSMCNTSTLDTEGSALQSVRIAEAGGELVRLTTQGTREASNMECIAQRIAQLTDQRIPLVADVHFNPSAAYTAATTCDKVRINPGNFVDAARTFKKLEFTDEEYAEEIDKIRKALVPFIELCRKHHTAVRLGVNHGSLSDRIMSRYGDSPAGMVESVMEFLRICRDEHFEDIVISVKASNTTVMVATVRLLVAAMEKEGMDFPLHLGVTEAGDGEDGRIKSAVGIGTLLAEGVGDTIRVSLSEAPENEIPVAIQLRDYITRREGHAPIPEPSVFAPFPARNASAPVAGIDPTAYPVAIGYDIDAVPDEWHHADASGEPSLFGDDLPVVLTSRHVNKVGEMQSWIERFIAAGGKNPVIGCIEYSGADEKDLQIMAGADFGTLLINGYLSGLHIVAPDVDAESVTRIEMGILQATRLRMTKTEYIACPGCGRTLFDLQSTLKEVKAATSHLKGLKIGVMGCIVNGPGEMADADYGYVGAGPGRVSIYKGKELVRKNIPTSEALPCLLQLIESAKQA